MSRTHRAHLPASRVAKRGPTTKARLAAQERHATGGGGVGFVKPHKQQRGNQRAQLRREWT